MEILPKRIYEIRKEKGISSILHANSVENACLFLRNRCLMSRETIEKRTGNQGCGCLDSYRNGKPEPEKMFTL